MIYLAPLDVFLAEDAIVQPDLLVLIGDRRQLVRSQGVIGAPDLVVEILSPGTSRRDRSEKADLYARFGVREYWLVSPETQTIEVLVPGEGGYSVHCRVVYNEPVSSTVLPGLSFPASAAFQS